MFRKKINFDLDEFRSRPLPSEEELMQGWYGCSTNPLVSVICATYNHRSYVKDALKGFLLQKTTFPFEILIHDDCSSDGTLEILKDYKNRYPNIIKLIAQVENQYSNGLRPTIYASSFASGSYLAICEGDDFWVDPEKLEFQASLLENNPGISMCFHNSYKLNCDSNDLVLFNESFRKKTIRARDIILRRWFSPTASFFLRKSVVKNIPIDQSDGANGDMLILFEASLFGDVLYDDEVRSVYRYLASGSASSKSSYRDLVNKKINFYKVVFSKNKSLSFYLMVKYLYYRLMLAKRNYF